MTKESIVRVLSLKRWLHLRLIDEDNSLRNMGSVSFQEESAFFYKRKCKRTYAKED